MYAKRIMIWFSRCCLFLLLPFGLFAQTHVGGPVEGVWTSAGNPYFVDSTLIIAYNTSLILDPGVELYFNNPDSIPDSLKVYGTLLAQGAEGDSVYFRGLGTVSWRGIWFRTGSTGCLLDYISMSIPERGIWCQNCEPVTISNSTILAQTIGIRAIAADFTLTNSVISVGVDVDTTSTVWGIQLQQSDPEITDTRIYCIPVPEVQNAFGIEMNEFSAPQILNCMIAVNASGMACGLHCTDVEKSIFRYNLLQTHAHNLSYAMWLSHSKPDLINNTIVAEADFVNPAKNIYLDLNSDPLIQNCILFGDGTSEGVSSTPQGNNDPLIRYCDFYNHYQNVVNCSLGVGNLLDDPLFVNSSSNFHLRQESPCIDTGYPLSPPDPDNSRADMGCYYFDHTVYAPSPEPMPTEFAVFDAFPNPFNARVELVVSLPVAQMGRISIYDQAGRLVHEFPWGLLQAGENHLAWDPENLSSSVYWAELRTKQGSMIRALNLLK